jgi:hypothetical protein
MYLCRPRVRNKSTTIKLTYNNVMFARSTDRQVESNEATLHEFMGIFMQWLNQTTNKY